MALQDRPAQALEFWENVMFLASRMHAFGLLTHDGLPIEPLGPVLHWPRFRALLTAGHNADDPAFIYRGKVKELQAIATLPALLNYWVRSSKRLFHVTGGLAQDCVARGRRQFNFDHDLLPHYCFGLSLSGVQLQRVGSDYGVDTMLYLGIANGPESMLTSLGLPELLEGYVPLTTDEKRDANAKVSTARVRRLISGKWAQICALTSGFLPGTAVEGEQDGINDYSLLTGFCELMANGNVVIGRRHSSHLGSVVDESPPADLMSEDICAVTASGVITVGQLIDGTPTGVQREFAGSVATHERRAHYRRAPGSQPTDPKTIRVRSCWINEDKKSKVNSVEGKIDDVRDS